MEVSNFFPEDGHIQRFYCSLCQKHLDLQFTEFKELVSGVDISISGLPVLHCGACNENYLPDDSKFAVIYQHQQAIDYSKNKVSVTRNKTNQIFDFSEVQFIYDSDDYKYIPGLKRDINKGFLTPVFFNKDVLIKYDKHPTYRLTFVSTTYGHICKGDDFSIPFGLNKNGKIIMWLGDIATLPKQEQRYLLSENIESDHSIGCEFYDAQIECIFTEASNENKLFKLRSEFIDACFKRFHVKIAHLDEEVFDLSVSFNSPLIDTDEEGMRVASILHKIYIESLNLGALGKMIRSLSDDFEEEERSLKRLERFLGLLNPGEDHIPALMSPLYVLNDLRIVYLHLISVEGGEQKLISVKNRLLLPNEAGLLEIYSSLIDGLTNSFNQFTNLVEDSA